jgi:hypothetical protein
MPENFKGWIDKNADRIAAAEKRGTLPYFIKDNKGYVSRNVARKGILSEINEYKRNNSYQTIFEKVKSLENEISLIKIEEGNIKDMGHTDGVGRIVLRKDQYQLFYNGVDKLMTGNASEITANEAQGILTYWHERIHNLPKSLYQLAKFKGNQYDIMDFSTEFVAQNTMKEFYAKFGANLPKSVNMSSEHSTTILNFNKVIDTLNADRQDVVSKIKHHIINGEWEDQRTGLINSLYGASINGKLIDKRKLGMLVDGMFNWQDFQAERKINKILGL